MSAAAARMIVAATSNDPRGEATYRVARLLGCDDPDRLLLAELLLDQTRDQLNATAGQDRERARAALEAVWRAELTDLAESPDKVCELRTLVAHIRTELPGAVAGAHKTARKREQWRDAWQPLPRIFDWYKANAIAGTLLAAGFVILKGYVIARGDISTAVGILQYAGLATIVTAGLLTSLPILTAAMLANRLDCTIRTWRRGWLGEHWRLAVVTAGAIVLAGLFAPWTYLPFAVLYGVLFGATQRPNVLKRFSSRSKLRKSATVAFVTLVGLPAAALFGVAVVVSLYSVWVPHEIVTFRPGTLPGGRTQEVDYVLSEGTGWTTLLTTGRGAEHAIIRVPDGAVTKQTVCERRPTSDHPTSIFFDAGTMWRLIIGVNSYLGATVTKACPYGAT